MKDSWKRKQKLRQLLYAKTSCRIQDGWPCNTCFHAMNLGLKPKKLHELWESQLLARETGYEKYIKQTHEDTQNNIDELIRLLK